MVATRPAEQRRGDANVAVLLTWFLPGAGHFYLGRVRVGLVALVLVEGLYALGWFLGQGRTFEFLDPELRGPMATLLTPEAGNLGAMLFHLRSSGFGELEPLPFPSGIVSASYLCALSGLFNLFIAVHAHLEAHKSCARSASGMHPVLTLFCAWLVPGLGHWLQGRRLRATLVFVLLMGLFLAGTWLCAGTNLSRERHFYYWSGQFLIGAPGMLAEAIAGHPRVTGELPLVDVGLLYACMAGLLNLLALLDVHGVAEQRWLADSEERPVATGSEVPA